MSIFELMNYFWFRNENESCSLSEIALYYYLIFEANRQHWTMPFKVSTQMLMARLGTSKQNIMKARDGLMHRGLICYVKGDGKGRPALYTLLISSAGNVEHSQELTRLLTQQTTPVLSQQVSETFTPELPHINNKEDNNKEEVKEGNHFSHSQQKKELTLEKLQGKILADTEWLNCLSKNLSSAGINLNDDELKGNINDFFDSLRSRNITHKEEADCRDYIYNWIKYHKKNNNDGQDSRNKSKSGRIDISNNRPEDYKGFC